MFLPLLISYLLLVWFRKKNKAIKSLIYCFFSILTGFLISSFYWLPIVFLAKFSRQGLNPTAISFPNLPDLLYSPWRFGLLFQGHKGELSYLIGYTQLLIIILSLYIVVKNTLSKQYKNLLIFFLVILGLLLFMILPISMPIWKNIPLLKYSQFSTRLLVVVALCISVIAGIIAKKTNKNWLIISLCILTISYTILNWGNRRNIPTINDDYLKKEFSTKPDVSGLEPSSPIWADLDKSKLRTKPISTIEITKGKALIKMLYRNPIQHVYTINAKTKIEVKENTLYFPGWIVSANNKQIPINYKNPNSPGVITFKLDKGSYSVNVKFTDLPIIIFSKWLAGISIFLLVTHVLILRNLFSKKSI